MIFLYSPPPLNFLFTKLNIMFIKNKEGKLIQLKRELNSLKQEYSQTWHGIVQNKGNKKTRKIRISCQHL